MIKETTVRAMNGIAMLILLLAVLGLCFYGLYYVGSEYPAGERAGKIWFLLTVLVIDLLGLGGFFAVQPNQAAVLQLFGNYKGTVKIPGLWWRNPFYTKKKVSLRVRNFETNHLKVNDKDGNPIEIAAVVVWQVVDSAEASFAVDNYENYVHVQSEAAQRNLATTYPYDSHHEHEVSLRGHTATVASDLKREIQERLKMAGVDVVEARISHLSYAPEIAAAMLRRQQAGAVIAARQKIVEGAVGMVESALDLLSQRKVVEFDADRRAAMVSNLLVVLCGEQPNQPVINTGTIYH